MMLGEDIPERPVDEGFAAGNDVKIEAQVFPFADDFIKEFRLHLLFVLIFPA